jgi:5-formyltetrahydrofolate cyclo-ligase
MGHQQKKELRREIKTVLANLDKRWVSRAHAEVCSELTQLMGMLREGRNMETHVLAWIPCFTGDVDLSPFIATMLRDSNVYLPCLDEQGTMSFVRILEDWGSRLVAGPRGMVQPHYDEPEVFSSPPDGDDVYIIVPGLAFDTVGRRLGRGAGHYDRFLSQPELQRAITIGVCWSMQVMQQIPMDAHDVSVQWLCHERGVLRVSNRES